MTSNSHAAATFSVNCANTRAPPSSKRGIVAPLTGANLEFEHNSREYHCSFWP